MDLPPQQFFQEPLWTPTAATVQSANLTKFMGDIPCQTYEELYEYSIKEPALFWTHLWHFCDVQAQMGSHILINAHDMEKAKFFPDARLNYAQNLLRRRDESMAIRFFGEDQVQVNLTWAQLYGQVAQLADVLSQWGVVPGDRIAGYLPNLPQTVVAMLATSSLGAVWSSCSPDFGVSGVVDRFGQIEPKVFLLADGYFYGGKTFDCLEKIPAIIAQLSTIEKVIVIPYTRSVPDLQAQSSGKWLVWDNVLLQSSAKDIHFEILPFNHPLFILYSSGTTGVPKCIIHGAGGTLLQHLKEHQLHCDLKPGDAFFYFTTCGWMMWNWLVSGLASQATLILYDGSPLYPTPEHLFDIADAVDLAIFGTSAKFIDNLAKLGVEPIKTHRLSHLRLMASTGSPLGPESYDYVYQSIKKDLCLASISGGTDIISCFILGNPIAPVWRGELQTRGLGLRVEVYDENGYAVQGQKGELVCTAPFPAQPLGFWNDPDGQKYHQAYYARFPNVWHHGDFVELTEHKGMIIYGRSDAVLNPGGVRIGTSEIYRQVEQLEEIFESLVVGQQWEQDVRVVLFVKLREGLQLSTELIQKIKNHIRRHTTPRHVPAKIIQVPDIPRTKNGKISELVVRQIIHQEVVKNKESLANPDALKYYENIPELSLG